MKERLIRALGPLVGIALFCGAIWILERELRHGDVLAHLRAIPLQRLALALALAALSYLALTGYDTLAIRHVKAPLDYPRVALTSFIAYVFSHNIGLAFFGGSAVRYRMLTSFGLSVSEIARVVVFNATTFWLGFAALGGAVFASNPRGCRACGRRTRARRPIGLLLLAALALYVGFVALRRRESITVFGFEIPLPTLGQTAAQLAISVTDWSLAASVLYALLPHAQGLSFAQFLSAYMLAIALGLVSNVPGGLGVFDTAMVVLLRRFLPGDVVLGCVLAYRVVYYLVPMAFALVLFAGYELLQRRDALARSRDRVALWASELVPKGVRGAGVRGGQPAPDLREPLPPHPAAWISCTSSCRSRSSKCLTSSAR